MTVPADLVGRESDVAARLMPRITAFVRGGQWYPDDTPMVPVSGLVVMSGPSPMLADDINTHAWMPLKLLIDEIAAGTVAPALEDAAVAASLGDPAGTLGLLAPCNQLLVYPPARHTLVVKAASEYWPLYESIGDRYSLGLREGRDLWSLPTNLGYVLGQLGVNGSALSAPLPPGGVTALVELARERGE